MGLEGGGLDACEVVIYGDPTSVGAECQVLIAGAHLLIRGGGTTAAGSAFGGPLGYGHQIGNGVARLPNNAFAYHGDAAKKLLGSPSGAGRCWRASRPLAGSRARGRAEGRDAPPARDGALLL